jgi:hypothetical protein
MKGRKDTRIVLRGFSERMEAFLGDDGDESG